MPLARPSILLVIQFENRFSRGTFPGVVAYTRQQTDWRLVSRTLDQVYAFDHGLKGFSGIISVSADPRVRQLAIENEIPCVRVGNSVDEQGASWVSVDDTAIGMMAAEYFAGLGLKHFAYVGNGDWTFVQERLAGFSSGLASRGFDPVQHVMGAMYDGQRTRFERGVEKLLRSLPLPCGLLAANDPTAAAVVDQCRLLGLRVPDDIAVLGVDDDELTCELSEVPLSSIASPLHAIGYEAARLLHQSLAQPGKPSTQMRLPPLRVVDRASSDLIALEDEDVVAALRLISRHLAEPIGVEWVVKQLPVARRTLYRKFKTLVGRTILDQIHHVRFQKAKELLAESDLSLDVVAQRSGFVSACWLGNCFRRELNTTPARFRRGFRAKS